MSSSKRKTSLTRIAFFGTPELVFPILEALKNAKLTPLLVVTQPDKPVGRKLIITPPPVKMWAIEHGIEVLQPQKIDADFIQELANSEWDLFVVCAYGMILPQALLTIPKHGVLNVHPSLLPLLRGASPVRTAILDNVKEGVGVSIMKLDSEMDHGPILAQASVELEEWPLRADILEKLLMHEGGTLLADLITSGEYSDISLYSEQDHTKATYSKKINKEMGEIRLDDDAEKNWRKYNAYYGWPGIFYFDNEGKRIKITEAKYEQGIFSPTKIIPEGKTERALSTE